MVAAIVVELDLTDELDLDALVLKSVGFAMKGNVDLK